MNIGEALQEYKVIFSIKLPHPIHIFGQEVASLDFNETVIMSWVVMAIIIIAAFALTRRLKQVPKGPQVVLEAGIEFLNNFAKEQFGRRAKTFAPYIGTIFLFLLLANMIGVVSPLGIKLLGVEAPFEVKPPTRDINLTAAMAIMTILLVLGAGIQARGPGGWFKNLFSPVPMMLPFNLLDYVVRPLSLCLRLFGNILGAYVIMLLVETALPVPAFVPPVLSLYFDFFDGFMQALIFTFLTTLFVAEAVETGKE